jgi:hypothetical protein
MGLDYIEILEYNMKTITDSNQLYYSSIAIDVNDFDKLQYILNIAKKVLVKLGEE